MFQWEGYVGYGVIESSKGSQAASKITDVCIEKPSKLLLFAT